MRLGNGLLLTILILDAQMIEWREALSVEKEVQALIIRPARQLKVEIHTVDDRFAE
jgi:hypothetical protein